MAAGNIAEIGIKVFLQDQASLGLRNVTNNLMSMSKAISTGVLAGFGASFLLFAVAIGLAVKNSIDFQTILIQMQRAGNLTDTQMKALGNTLMAIGGKSIFSLESLGNAFVVLLQRGVSAKDIMSDVGQAAVYLAEATGQTAVQGAQQLASALVAFNIPASKAAQTADLLQFIIEHGIGPSDELTAALARLGAIAGILHLTLADITPAFDILSRATGSYALAATNLYYYLNQVKFGTSTYRTEIQKLGISFYDAHGNFVGLNQSLVILYNTLKDKSPQEAAKILGSLFNIRSSQGIGILMKDLKDLAPLTDKLAKSHDNLNMAMLRARQAEDSAAGAWNGFKTNLQDVLTLMGGPFLASIQPVLLHLRDMASDLRNFMSLNPQVGATFLKLGLAIAGGGLLAALIIINPMLVLLGGIVLAIVAGVTWLALNFQNLVKWFSNVRAAGSYVGQVFDTLIHMIQQLWGWLTNQLSFAFQAVQRTMQKFGVTGTDLWNILKFLGGVLLTIVVIAILAVVTVVVGLIAAIAWLISFLASVVVAIIGFFKSIPQWGAMVVQWFKDLPGRIMSWLSGLPGMLYQWGVNAMRQLGAGLWAAISSVFAPVDTAAQHMANVLGHHSSPKFGPLSDDDQWMPNMMKMFAEGVISNTPMLQAAAARAASGIASGYQGAPYGTGGSIVIHNVIQLDGRVVYDNVMNRMNGDLQLNGLGRAFR